MLRRATTFLNHVCNHRRRRPPPPTRMDRPTQLTACYGAQFTDASVAASYHTRPPYPADVFNILARLCKGQGGPILELGCGTGDLTHGLAHLAGRVEAVDPSAAMLAVAAQRPGTDSPAIRWICRPAEDYEFGGPYALAVAAESFHWMEWDIVCRKLAPAPAPGGFLAIVERVPAGDMPRASELAILIPRYSTNQKFQPYDLISEITARGLFQEKRRETTTPVTFSQPVEDHIESFHSRNAFSKQRMSEAACRGFDGSLRELLAAYCPEGIVKLETAASVVWGFPGV